MNALTVHQEHAMLLASPPLCDRAPHANRPTAPKAHKSRKYWFGMSEYKRGASRLNSRMFAV